MVTTFWRSLLTPVHKSTSEPGESPRYLICALLETLPDLQLLAAIAHRRRRRGAALSRLLHGEAVSPRRESACRQCIDEQQWEQHCWSGFAGAVLLQVRTLNRAVRRTAKCSRQQQAMQLLAPWGCLVSYAASSNSYRRDGRYPSAKVRTRIARRRPSPCGALTI